MMKKQITLQDLFNKMDENFDCMWAEFTDLREKLTQITGNNSENSTQNSKNDIPDTEYVTITADDVLVGGKSVTEYHGEKIYNLYHCPAYLKEARDSIREENGCELLEIHCLQSSTGGEWLKTGNPVADKDGVNCWVRIKFKDTDGAERVSLWAFISTFSSDAVCASNCTYNCGNYVQNCSSLRAGLFGSVAN